MDLKKKNLCIVKTSKLIGIVINLASEYSYTRYDLEDLHFQSQKNRNKDKLGLKFFQRFIVKVSYYCKSINTSKIALFYDSNVCM